MCRVKSCVGVWREGVRRCVWGSEEMCRSEEMCGGVEGGSEEMCGCVEGGSEEMCVGERGDVSE